MTETISAIVVNYNAGEILRECVYSLIACPYTSEKALPTIWRKRFESQAKTKVMNADVWRVLDKPLWLSR